MTVALGARTMRMRDRHAKNFADALDFRIDAKPSIFPNYGGPKR